MRPECPSDDIVSSTQHRIVIKRNILVLVMIDFPLYVQLVVVQANIYNIVNEPCKIVVFFYETTKLFGSIVVKC